MAISSERYINLNVINSYRDQMVIASQVSRAINRDVKRDAITAFVCDMAICDETNCARSDRFQVE